MDLPISGRIAKGRIFFTGEFVAPGRFQLISGRHAKLIKAKTNRPGPA